MSKRCSWYGELLGTKDLIDEKLGKIRRVRCKGYCYYTRKGAKVKVGGHYRWIKTKK
ncbi:MAG: hypothetical protein DDT33_01559 [Firmicutes bacterium]|nr:hypothetical protein [Bacillota bacterium]